MVSNTPAACPFCGNINYYGENQTAYLCIHCATVVQLTNFQAEAKKVESAVLDKLDDLVLQRRAEKLQQMNSLFAQATGLQRSRRFTEAEQMYRQLLTQEGDDDPELYWRILMCRYCVEYQQDDDGKYVPFILYPDLEPCCNQPEYDYLFDCTKSDEQAADYRQKLDAIEAILSRYRELRPTLQYDVFISVKQSRPGGGYTPDSDKAFELYHYLTKKGLKVFNSRCTPIPAGQEYEPYIISALISSKVMIVVGSTPDNMEARWVKNEWSRFQWLQHFERTHRLLFCYLVGGMDPYDIPRELNPNKQAISDGIGAEARLDATLNPLFQDYTKPTPSFLTGTTGVATTNSAPKAIVKHHTIFRYILICVVTAAAVFLFAFLPQLFRDKTSKQPINNIVALLSNTATSTPSSTSTSAHTIASSPTFTTAPSATPTPTLAPISTPTPTPTNPKQYLIDTDEQANQYAAKRNISGLYMYYSSKYGKTDALYKTYQLLYNRIGYGDIASAYNHAVGLQANGTLYTAGSNEYDQLMVAEWNNVIAIDTSPYHTVGLKNDGSVLAVGDNKDGKCDVTNWTNIVAISAASSHTVGLKADGTVLATGQNVYSQCDVQSWKNIIAVFTGYDYTIGLKEDGTLIYTGKSGIRQEHLSSWTDIVNISTGGNNIVGITTSGTALLYTPNNFDHSGITYWTNLIEVVFNSTNTSLGLKANGSIYAPGEHLNITDAVAIVPDGVLDFVVLMSDGTVLSIYKTNPFNITSWPKIGSTNTLN